MNLKKFLGLEFYTSPLDQFLTDFDRTHTQRSRSQCAEESKYKHISSLRDFPQEKKQTEPFWSEF